MFGPPTIQLSNTMSLGACRLLLELLDSDTRRRTTKLTVKLRITPFGLDGMSQLTITVVAVITPGPGRGGVGGGRGAASR